MGAFEQFIYSSKFINSERLVNLLEHKVNRKLCDYICVTQIKQDIKVTQVKMFGKVCEIDPIELKKGTWGIVVRSNLKADYLFSLYLKISRNIKSVCIDYIVLSCDEENKNKVYTDYFNDKE